MWVVEVWNKTTRKWKRVGNAEDFEKAKKAVCLLANQYGVAQGTEPDAAFDEVRLMRAYKGRGFWSSTGSGGLLG